MSPKQLRWYEAKFLDACGLCGLYGCTLSIDQFAACMGLEPADRDLLLQYLESHSICL